MSLFDQLRSALSGEHAGLLGNVLDTLGKEQGGGLPGLIQAFKANGLGTGLVIEGQIRDQALEASVFVLATAGRPSTPGWN